MSLGRGLESLIPKQQSQGGNKPHSAKTVSSGAPAKEKNDSKEHIFFIETSKISPNPHQPRRDFNEDELASLASSIEKHGIIQPLVVTKHEIERKDGMGVKYHIVAGERRWRAAKLAGFERVPVVIRKATEQNRLELALIENLQRSNLNPIEEAQAYKKLAEEFSLTQEQIAEQVGKSRESVANKIRLLVLPYDVQKMLSGGAISEGHAKVILSISSPERQIYLANQAYSNNLSVRALETVVKSQNGSSENQKQIAKNSVDPELLEYQKNIQESLGLQTSISGSKQKGKLAMNFYSQDELEKIIKKLTQ